MEISEECCSHTEAALERIAKRQSSTAFGAMLLGQAVYKMVVPQPPHFETIGLIGLLALAANSTCLALPWRHRVDDINMRSVWLCLRNDIITNISVLLAAGGVWLSLPQWPDVLIGVGIALVFFRSAIGVIRDAIHTMKRIWALCPTTCVETLIT